MVVAGWLLAVSALLGTGLLAVVNQHSEPYIAENERIMLLRSLNEVVPIESYDNEILEDQMMVLAPEYLGSKKASIVYRARKAGKPVAVVLTVVAPNGYSGPIVLLVGIDYSGDITGVRVVKHRETPGLGDAIEIERSDWIERFTGKSRRNPGRAGWKVKRDGGEFDQLTGATITPRAVVAAVSGALEYFEHNRDNLFISNAEIQARDEEAKGLQQ
ncbi:MAG TPA: electron transport complex subunit RsxG [Chromatiaceae bacterium]|jgi:electron transport complex protein RnfG|nr:electron transport complex subunit RsxG [Chromatiaceae bacterium]HIB84017.1 electron transport complex subunit RsxG [Chromatiaceae bacterium]HIN81993.1 electron transport complex subunit RsxG [Chromatiales bacterium]HIO14116.1 electron transport complex subunit RsxG [Chromatiales bacterium]HIO54265.1 electron transport complex subunit RsxG [Chromatiales bacterium]